MKRPTSLLTSSLLVVAMFFAPGNRASALDPSCDPTLSATHASQIARGGGGEEKEPTLNEPTTSLPSSAKGKGGPEGSC